MYRVGFEACNIPVTGKQLLAILSSEELSPRQVTVKYVADDSITFGFPVLDKHATQRHERVLGGVDAGALTLMTMAVPTDTKTLIVEVPPPLGKLRLISNRLSECDVLIQNLAEVSCVMVCVCVMVCDGV